MYLCLLVVHDHFFQALVAFKATVSLSTEPMLMTTVLLCYSDISYTCAIRVIIRLLIVVYVLFGYTMTFLSFQFR